MDDNPLVGCLFVTSLGVLVLALIIYFIKWIIVGIVVIGLTALLVYLVITWLDERRRDMKQEKELAEQRSKETEAEEERYEQTRRRLHDLYWETKRKLREITDK
ncbi:hypothetical protein AB0H73_21845 [Streptomyces olivoreticuli]